MNCLDFDPISGRICSGSGDKNAILVSFKNIAI